MDNHERLTLNISYMADLYYVLCRKANSICKTKRATVIICNLQFTTFPWNDSIVEKPLGIEVCIRYCKLLILLNINLMIDLVNIPDLYDWYAKYSWPGWLISIYIHYKTVSIIKFFYYSVRIWFFFFIAVEVDIVQNRLEV